MNKAILVMFAVTVFSLAGAAQPQVNQTESSVDPGLMPGNPLYGLEQFVEGLEVRIAGAIGGPDMKSKALANNAEERLAEANALADMNRSEEASKMIQEYSDSLNRSRNLAAGNNNSALTEQLDNISRKNTQKLEEVKNKVPEQAREAIQKAIDNSNRPEKTGRPENPGKSEGKIVPGKDEDRNITGRPETPGKESNISGKNMTSGKTDNPGKNLRNSKGKEGTGVNKSLNSEKISNKTEESPEDSDSARDAVDNTTNGSSDGRSTDETLDNASGKSDDIDRPERP